MNSFDVNGIDFNISNNKDDKKARFDKFVMEEYKNLSQAHYNTVESISNFFKHYLVIAGVPLALGSLIEKNLFQGNIIFLCSVYFLIALVGFFVCAYIINLRCDVLFYARAVNGIRNYFIEKANFPYYRERMYRVLPRNKELPAYLEHTYFLSVIIVFAIINTFYAFLGLIFLDQYCFLSDLTFNMLIILTFIFFLMHYYVYRFIAYYRENNYLRSRIIGVDIDGVLNKHRKHFCKILERETSIQIRPTTITKIPVHECKKLNLKYEDERKVFNTISYWKDMPVAKNAEDNIKKIKNVLQYKIYIFTTRPWPDFNNIPIDVIKKYRKQWNGTTIKKLTTQWLKEKGIVWDRFFLEANTASEVKTGIKNRFTLCKSKKIDIFVEDQVENALRLCPMCSIVFLIKHPYNKKMVDNKKLPSNIIPVDSWNDIYHYMRNLL